MKFILLSLLLCVQSVAASVHEYTFRNNRIIICDDYFLPIAKVGIIYPIGLSHLKNISEAEILKEIFLSENSKLAAQRLGTEISINIQDTFSEVSAIISINQITNLIKTLLDNKFSIDNLELIKNKIRINYKLSNYFGLDIVNNEIFSYINPKYIFNVSIFENLTKDDLQKTLEKYENSRISIIICGKVSYQQLIHQLDLKKAPLLKTSNKNQIVDVPPKTTDIRSKFLGRSLFYIYRQDPTKKKQRAILSLLNFELFDYLIKNSQIINAFRISSLYSSNALIFSFSVKKDISLKSFEQSYKSFLSHLKKKSSTEEQLNYISKIESFSEIRNNEDISSKYEQIRDKYILQIPREEVSKEILTISSEDIKNFVESTLESNFTAKISTQHEEVR